jgi:Mg2+ and Co2+ transporter CorA
MPDCVIKDHGNCGIGALAPVVAASSEAESDMEGTLRYLTVLALVAVLLVLLAGLWNMMRGTSPNLSQTLMRWRVVLQFLAIVIAMILVYFLRP